MFNLFDATTGFQGCAQRRAAECPGPRNASNEERNAYLRWIAARDGIDVPATATFGPEGIRASGELILAMPGYGDTRRAVMETLDDHGNVIRSTPIAVDARGHMTLSKAQVQEASGLKPVKAKRGKAAPVAPIVEESAPIADEPDAMPETPASEPQDAQEALNPTADTHDAPDALHGAEIDAWRNIDGDDLFAGQEVGNGDTMAGLAAIYGADNFRVQDGCCQVRGSLPPEFVGIESRVMQNATGQGPVTLRSAPTADASDPIAAIEARLAELERAVAALSVESTAGAAPTVAKRTPAHERAVRRAWAERKARRAAVAGMNIHARRIDALELELQLANDERALDKQAIAEAYARAEQFARRGNQHRERRHRATVRARRMIESARAQATAQAGRASMAEAALARLKRDIADPVQPERASDLARLIQERDAARTASAALQARADRAERAVHDLAGRFEEMVSRVARAEAAVRKVMAA